MRGRISVAVSSMILVFTLVFSFAGPVSSAKVFTDIRIPQVVNSSADKSFKTNVISARFLNMLNHSFVYDKDFYDTETLVNNSVLALLDVAVNGFVKEEYVSDYIFNMYGIRIDDFSVINTEFEQKEGFVYILPRGYSICKHEIATVTDNCDGSYTVVTEVEISLDDGSIIKDTATTVFLKNTDSQFGFNIVYSEIGAETENVVEC